ncbi:MULTISPECIES: translocation/assembly module TamB domain-containing protein [Halocynthiibacter]|uniref:Translocation/assembly module TamB domain-containing protein n=1 Tax=Halocynthiibacter halioticoli TaxID=2986804 RepID=A0AAE3J298_9RHOB|nr:MULTISPECIES: translocation/assembly module TamB domain-containing protein [Halocynthiibacter]MCV6823892.1 translocation/assembly module TamB domain-containing protein [Halocynthiibacter halioticoli]MCW4056893.1 translocation/assembly module TamB domain-containing protein [Halocynthiibacter sp. SDUM655004]
MRLFRHTLLLLLAACLALFQAFAEPAYAQEEEEEDRGLVQGLLEDNLSGEGRTVKVKGFKGALSSTATMDELTIADKEGIWLTLTDVRLNWKRSALLQRRLEVKELSAASMVVARAPIPVESTEPPDPHAKEFALPELPVSVDVQKVAIEEVVLGEPLLGEEIALELAASAVLEAGSGKVLLNMGRIDDSFGEFDIRGGFDAETKIIDLDIALTEEEGGLAATLLKIPGAPALELDLKGTGPLSDYTAEVKLVSEGVEQLSGQVNLVTLPIKEGEDETTPADMEFRVDIGGDLTSLFVPEYRPFFGPNVQLKSEGTLKGSGALDLAHFRLSANSLLLSGRAYLNADMWPEHFDVSGRVANADGSYVLLPVPGGKTRVESVALALSFDADEGEKWHGKFDVRNLETEGLSLERSQLISDGEIFGEVGTLGKITSDLTFRALGLELDDPALTAAIGPATEGRVTVSYEEGQPLRLTDMDIKSATYEFRGNAALTGLESDLEAEFDIAAEIDDISQFSLLAGRPIAGQAEATAKGSYATLTGAFDAVLTGLTRDLALGIEQFDTLAKGETVMRVTAKRDTEGTVLRGASLRNDALFVRGTGEIADGYFDGEFDANLVDLGLIVPDFPGPLTLKGYTTQSEEGVSVNLAATGPLDTNATVEGLATGPNANMAFSASLPEVGTLVANLTGGVNLEGALAKAGEKWQIDATSSGSLGVAANVSGLIDPEGDHDLALTGTAPLGLANRILRPRAISGIATLDLAMKGVPSLAAISGTISTNGATFTAPRLHAAIEDISGTVRLANSTATIDIGASPREGGRVTASGTVGFGTGFPANLAVVLNRAKIVDPLLYQTVLNGEIDVTGPLTGGALIAGTINVGRTEVTVPNTSIGGVTAIPDITQVGASGAVRRTLEFAGVETDPAAQTAAGPAYPLQIQINAEDRVFVRGRGLDAELGGSLQISGTTNNVVSAGSFGLIRGRINLLDKRFELTEGQIELQGSLDPYVRLVATTFTDGGSSSIIVEGFLSEPEIRFESSPEAPPDQVLTRLYYGEDASNISAFQALQLANAVAVLSGRGNDTVMGSIRKGLGVDDIEIINESDGETAVRAGKYLTDDLYSDITVRGDGKTEFSLNYDVTKKLSAKGKVISDGNSAIGLFYETDY